MTLFRVGHRADVGGSVCVANRTVERAEAIAAEVDGDAIGLDELGNEHLEEADVVVSATGAADRVLTFGDLVGHELVLFDLANPRDVDPAAGDLEDIRLVSLDELLAVRNEGLERREGAIPEVETIIEEERARLGDQLRADRVEDTLSQLYSGAHDLRESEFERALVRLRESDESLSETQEEAMRDFSEALVSKLLHPKAAALRRVAISDDRETVDAWVRLFDRSSEAMNAPRTEQAGDDPAQERTRDTLEETQPAGRTGEEPTAGHPDRKPAESIE